MARKIIKFLLKYRLYVLLGTFLVTGFFASQMGKVEFTTIFSDQFPQKHPYVKVHNKFRNTFGGANRVIITVTVKEGDIYNVETLGKIQDITRRMYLIHGVNQYQINSATDIKAKVIKLSAWGMQADALMWPDIPRTNDEIEELVYTIHRNPAYGSLVSLDDKSAQIIADFLERERMDYRAIFNSINEICEPHRDANTEIAIAGEPVLYGWIYRYLPQVSLILGLTSIFVLVLLYLYIRTLGGMLVPLSSIVVGIIWGLGFAGMLGFNLDPLILLIPFIICARAASHSVQMVQRFNEEYSRLKDVNSAVEEAFVGLLPPGVLSMVTDAAGVLVIAIAPMPLMQKLAFVGAFWVISLVVGGFICDPIILSYLPPPKRVVERFVKKTGILDRALAKMGSLCYGKGRFAVLGTAVALIAFGVVYTGHLTIGDARPGSSILWPDSVYNRSVESINKRFLGADAMYIVAEGERGMLRRPEVLKTFDSLQRTLEENGGASGTESVYDLLPLIHRNLHYGFPKWYVLPDSEKGIGYCLHSYMTGSTPGDFDRLFSPFFAEASIMAFFEDHRGKTIEKAIEGAKDFIASHPIEKVNFKLAGGLMGILAAANEEIVWAQKTSLIACFCVIFVFCTIVYRSFFAGFLFVISLVIANLVGFGFMAWRHIGLNINTLPVSALAIGLGVDYGLYVISRLRERFKMSMDLKDATITTVTTAGKAVVITATTLVLGIALWSFSPLRFQAEMGFLLALMMFVNMLGGVLLLPALVNIFRPKFVTGEKVDTLKRQTEN